MHDRGNTNLFDFRSQHIGCKRRRSAGIVGQTQCLNEPGLTASFSKRENIVDFLPSRQSAGDMLTSDNEPPRFAKQRVEGRKRQVFDEKVNGRKLKKYNAANLSFLWKNIR